MATRIFCAFLAGTGAWYWVFWIGMKYDLPLITPMAWIAALLLFVYTYERVS